MRCHNIIKLAYFEDNELMNKDREKITKHLAKCDSCTQQFNEIRKSFAALSSLKIEPTLHNPTSLTNDIMRSVRRFHVPHQQVLTFSEKVLDLMTHPKIRIAFGATLVMLLSIFCIQEATVHRRLYNLEQRIGRQMPGVTVSRSPLTSLRNKMELIDSQSNTEQIVIDKEALEKIVQSYNDLKIENKLLLKMLEEKSLTTAGISIKDGLTRDEIKHLINNDHILKEMYNL